MKTLLLGLALLTSVTAFSMDQEQKALFNNDYSCKKIEHNQAQKTSKDLILFLQDNEDNFDETIWGNINQIIVANKDFTREDVDSYLENLSKVHFLLSQTFATSPSPSFRDSVNSEAKSVMRLWREVDHCSM